MTKNVRVVRAAGLPDSETYPRRAKQLVQHGRAAWLDENTIQLTADLPGERAEDMDTVTESPEIDATDTPVTSGPGGEGGQELLQHLRALVEKALHGDDMTSEAIQAIQTYCTCGDVSPADAPAQAIARIYAANQELKTEALRVMKEFLILTAER